MISSWHIAVLVPARNEEALLARCLRSVMAAGALLPPGTTLDIVVVSDLSTDSTAEIASAMLGSTGCVVHSEAGCVGRARALAAQTALARVPHRNLSRCWLANTDADCEVPQDWLLHHLKIAESGHCAVAGVIDVDSFEEHQEIVRSRFRSTYLLHLDGTHPHVHGANLGVRADGYLLAGGWSPLSTAEDHDLWCRLKALPVKCIATSALQVLTSGRRVGRAPAGFADALAAHNETAVDLFGCVQPGTEIAV